ncbi:hypothetical protein BJY01DRAFT_254788 [Aspergillus pseudoustus]|uniref:Uncharacterized protein n=1 Tax=Aspergillus pseudoustus TaxID=1810923 RepID=A0ABR4IQS4_9EURO
MKFVGLAIWLSFTLVATAFPTGSDDSALDNPASDTLADIAWVDDEDYKEDLEDDDDSDFDFEDNYSDTADLSTTSTSPANTLIKAARTLEKRHTVRCTVGEITDPWRVYDGINSLRKKKGTPHARARTCVRSWCKKGTSIGWCNDSFEVRDLPSYNNIADGIHAIWSECVKKEGVSLVGGVSGEVDHPDLWRAIVHNTWGCDH